MSADRWSMCPRCKARRQAKADAALAAADEQYGKASIQEFDALRNEYLQLQHEVENPDGDRETFREDYEITSPEYGNEIAVSYRGSCEVCGLSLSFEHTHPLEV